MSAAAPVQDLFQESTRVSGSAGAFDGSSGGFPSLEPLRTRATSTTGSRGHPKPTAAAVATNDADQLQQEEGGDKGDGDALFQQYVDAAQELIVPEGELASVKELAFAFQRAASRLLEVRAGVRACVLGWLVGCGGLIEMEDRAGWADCVFEFPPRQMASEDYIAAHTETRIPGWEAARRGKKGA